jgi:hypothetical protein
MIRRARAATMCSRFSPLAAPLLLAPFLLAACQPLPHPFADQKQGPATPVLAPPDAVGIVVPPVAGAPPPAAAAVATAMADALMKEDVPADTAETNSRSYHLSGTATAQPLGDHTRITIAWRLAGADGHVVATETESAEVADAAWRAGDPQMAKALVAGPAPVLARRVEGDAPLEHAVKEATLGIAPVTGASGDGGQALSLAIAAALHRAGIALQEKPDDKPSYLLAGKVAIGAASAGHQDVKIVWALSRADGKEIGQVSQENAVPAGSLDGKWGDTAYDVATAAVGGIVQLLQQAQATGS